jgi:hypothetical protein
LGLLAGVAVFGGLAKATLLFTGFLCVAVVAVDLLLRGRGHAGAGLLTGFLLGWLAAWLALGQRLSNIGEFITTTVEVVRGYSAAMGLEQLPLFARLGLCVTLLAILLHGYS